MSIEALIFNTEKEQYSIKQMLLPDELPTNDKTSYVQHMFVIYNPREDQGDYNIVILYEPDPPDDSYDRNNRIITVDIKDYLTL